MGRTVANELVDYVLEWMLEGWYFGERKSNMKMQGFVPSMQSKTPISTFQAFVMKENRVMKTKMLERKPQFSDAEMERKQTYKTTQGVVSKRWGPIQYGVDESNMVRKAIRIGSICRSFA